MPKYVVLTLSHLFSLSILCFISYLLILFLFRLQLTLINIYLWDTWFGNKHYFLFTFHQLILPFNIFTLLYFSVDKYKTSEIFLWTKLVFENFWNIVKSIQKIEKTFNGNIRTHNWIAPHPLDPGGGLPSSWESSSPSPPPA